MLIHRLLLSIYVILYTQDTVAAPIKRTWTFEQLKTELNQQLSGPGAIEGKLRGLKEQGALSKYGSAVPGTFRRYSPDAFAQQTGIQPQEIESGGSQDDLKSVSQASSQVVGRNSV